MERTVSVLWMTGSFAPLGSDFIETSPVIACASLVKRKALFNTSNHGIRYLGRASQTPLTFGGFCQQQVPCSAAHTHHLTGPRDFKTTGHRFTGFAFCCGFWHKAGDCIDFL